MGALSRIPWESFLNFQSPKAKMTAANKVNMIMDLIRIAADYHSSA